MKAFVRDVINRFGPVRRAYRTWRPLPLGDDQFLRSCRSIVHVGANSGDERFLYESLGLQVIWIEPIPNVFVRLLNNIRGFRGQAALQALVTDRSGEQVVFNIANNNGASSSIFAIAEHEKIWPDVHFVETITLPTSSLDDIISPSINVDAIVIDTQGAELLVLRGATRLLRTVRFVKAEAADFASYHGGCNLEDLTEFLSARGFREMTRKAFASKEGVGRYYDLVWTVDTSARSRGVQT